MKPVELIPATKEVIVMNTQNYILLSERRKKDIEHFWMEMNKDGTFHRGEVFNVCSIIEDEDVYKILLNCTDYAHYLYSVRNHITDMEGCRVVYGAGLVETCDSKYIFGEMGNHTAYPGRLQCVGGGLSWEDENENCFNIQQSVLRELAEELGVHNNGEMIEKCTPKFIKFGGTYDFLVILYHIKLKISAKEFLEKYHEFTINLKMAGEKPEFQKVICLDSDKKSIAKFFRDNNKPCVDYLRPYLEQMAQRE